MTTRSCVTASAKRPFAESTSAFFSFSSVCHRDEVRAVVLTGAGRGFCAGADMGMLQGIQDVAAAGGSSEDAVSADQPWRDPQGEFGGRFTYLMDVGKPIIAAVNGAVAGMAFPLTLCCDLRVSVPTRCS